MDQTRDLALTELYRYTQLYAFPGYVSDFLKTASTLAPEPEAPSHIFADTIHRQFPAHNKAATYLSCLYFLNKQSQMQERHARWTRENLVKAAEFFDILPDVKELEAKHAELNNECLGRLPDSAFGIVTKQAGDQQVREYPLRNGLEVRAAASWLVENQDRLPYEKRRKLATAIREKAAEFGLELPQPEELRKLAGRGVCDSGDAVQLVVGRIHATPLKPHFRQLKEGMARLAVQLANHPELTLDPVMLDKLAETIDRYDRETHLVTKYGSAVQRPADVLFAIDTDAAATLSKSACELTTGAIYDPEQFTKLSTGDVRELFGREFADQVTTGILVDPVKLAEVAPTLPRPQAVMLEQLLKQAGEPPLLKTATKRLGFGDLQELSQLELV